MDGPAKHIRALGLAERMTVMVHSSLRQAGRTVGGAVTVIRALRDVIGADGALVMPAETPQLSDRMSGLTRVSNPSGTRRFASTYRSSTR